MFDSFEIFYTVWSPSCLCVVTHTLGLMCSSTGASRGADGGNPTNLNVPLVTQRQVPTIQFTQKTVEIPQVQFKDTEVDEPVVQRQRRPTRKPRRLRRRNSRTCPL